MTGGPETTVLVVTWRAAGFLADCLTALRSQTVPYRLLVVDNASTDGTAGVLAGLPRGPGAADAAQPRLRRRGRGRARGRGHAPVALLNDDAVPAPGWLAALAAALAGARRGDLADAAAVRGAEQRRGGAAARRLRRRPRAGRAGRAAVRHRGRGVRLLRRRRAAGPAAVRAVGGFPTPVLPLLRGHRRLLAAAAGRRRDRVRARAPRSGTRTRRARTSARPCSPSTTSATGC